MQTILLLDLSGSVDPYLSQLIAAVTAFIQEASLPHNNIAIFGFGGNATEPLVPIISYTTDQTALINTVKNLANYLPSDRSTNLYGAIMDTMHEINERLAATASMFTEGIVVVFTDGSDRANAHTLLEAQTAINSSVAVTYGISLGGEINDSILNVRQSISSLELPIPHCLPQHIKHAEPVRDVYVGDSLHVTHRCFRKDRYPSQVPS
jgi:hypothetical protein